MRDSTRYPSRRSNASNRDACSSMRASASPSPSLEGVGDLVEAELGAAGFGERRPQLLQDRAVGVEPGLLAEVAQAFGALRARAAGEVVVLAGEDAEQRRLAGAVRADESHALAFADGEGDVTEDLERAEGLRYRLGVEHT